MQPSVIHFEVVHIQRGRQNRERERICIPKQDGRNLAKGQPLSTGVFAAGDNFMRESQRQSSAEKEEARDPDPDVEARQHCCNMTGDYENLIHAAP